MDSQSYGNSNDMGTELQEGTKMRAPLHVRELHCWVRENASRTAGKLMRKG